MRAKRQQCEQWPGRRGPKKAQWRPTRLPRAPTSRTLDEKAKKSGKWRRLVMGEGKWRTHDGRQKKTDESGIRSGKRTNLNKMAKPTCTSIDVHGHSDGRKRQGEREEGEARGEAAARSSTSRGDRGDFCHRRTNEKKCERKS